MTIGSGEAGRSPCVPDIRFRLLMLRNACRRGDFLGWTRESCEWFEMNGMVRRLYIGDGLAVNAHEDEFLGSGLDSVSVSGRGVSMMLNLFDSDVAFHYWGFEICGPFKNFRIGFHPSDIGSRPAPPSDITDHDAWNHAEAERLMSLVCLRDEATVSEDPMIRLGEGLTIVVDRETLGRLTSPQVDVTYRQGAVSAELRGTLMRCGEGVAVVDRHGSFMVIAISDVGIEETGGFVLEGLRATLSYLNSNLDACCEGPWGESRSIPKNPGTGGEVLCFPFQEGLLVDPGWRDVNTCLGVDGSYDCDLFWAGFMHDEGFLGPKPGPVNISFVFKPTNFRIHDWSRMSEPTLSQPLTEGELRHLMRLCREHARCHPQNAGVASGRDY